MLAERFDNIEKPLLTSGRFADVYRTTYKGQLVVVKTFKITSVDNLEKLCKVSGLIFHTITQSVYVTFTALCEGGCRM